MKTFEIGNGHTIEIASCNGLSDNYKITFYEDNRVLFTEYGNREYIEYQYEVEL